MESFIRQWMQGARAYRLAVGVALVAALLLFWINGAVGMIGSEDNPANLLYIGVFVVGIAGVVRARLEPRGMRQAMITVAITQILVPVVALVIWRPDVGPGIVVVFMFNMLFSGLWIVAALLFGRAGIIPKV